MAFGSLGRLALTLGPARSAASDPIADIWAVPGTQGGVISFIASDYSGTGHWQESTRSTPATSGQPLGYVDPLYGSLHLEQSNAGSRPTMGVGRMTLSSSAYMFQPAPGYGLPESMIGFVAEETPAADLSGIVVLAPASGSDRFEADSITIETENSSRTIRTYTSGGNTSLNITETGTSPMPKAAYVLHTTGGTSTLYKNGVSIGSVAATGLAATHGGNLLFGARYELGVTNFFSGHFYSRPFLLCGRAATSDERALLTDFLMEGAGL